MEFNFQWTWKFWRITQQSNPRSHGRCLNFSIAFFWLQWVTHYKHLSSWVKPVFCSHMYLGLWIARERINEIVLIRVEASKFPLIIPLWNYRNKRKLLNNVEKWKTNNKPWYFGIRGTCVKIFSCLTVKDCTRHTNSLRNSIILNHLTCRVVRSIQWYYGHSANISSLRLGQGFL